jgi:hypothetical protein
LIEAIRFYITLKIVIVVDLIALSTMLIVTALEKGAARRRHSLDIWTKGVVTVQIGCHVPTG